MLHDLSRKWKDPRDYGKINTKFDLSIRDIEIIEIALRAKAGRRGIAIAQGETSPQLKQEMQEIQELLGKIHEKIFMRPKIKILLRKRIKKG